MKTLTVKLTDEEFEIVAALPGFASPAHATVCALGKLAIQFEFPTGRHLFDQSRKALSDGSEDRS